MNQPKFLPDRLVTRSNLVLPGAEAMMLAREVFASYSASGAQLDLLAQLRRAYTPGIMGRLILPKTIEDFRRAHYLRSESSSGSIESLTHRGHVAISMVEVSVDDTGVDTWLTEPFKDVSVLQYLEPEDHPLALTTDEFRVRPTS
ncbi:MAG TPA: hypothetical protein PL051_02415 [Candidatus Saccharibacteria bacterium]|nr:hypothetical protein [Candidatus Saccharibacteria bacterium]